MNATATPHARDLVGRKAWVRATGPTGAVWEGEAVAWHEEPGVVIRQTGGSQICVPAAFKITEIERPYEVAVAIGMPGSPAYTIARDAARATIRARCPEMDAHESHRLAVAVTEAIYNGLYEAITEVPW